MGDKNQLDWVTAHRGIVKGPILEVGSKDYGHTPNYRALFPTETYVGVDMEAGPGVDRVVDLTDSFPKVWMRLGQTRFRTVICNSVLEHCKQPFRMARNLERLLLEEGVLFVSVPFVWRIHGYPSDYWRFTPAAVRTLFPHCDFEWHSHRHSMCTWKLGEVVPLHEGMFAHRDVMGYREMFPEVVINLVGRKDRFLPVRAAVRKRLPEAAVEAVRRVRQRLPVGRLHK